MRARGTGGFPLDREITATQILDVRRAMPREASILPRRAIGNERRLLVVCRKRDDFRRSPIARAYISSTSESMAPRSPRRWRYAACSLQTERHLSSSDLARIAVIQISTWQILQ